MKDFQDGMRLSVYQRKMEGMKVELFRVEGEFKGIKPQDQVDFLINPPKSVVSAVKEHRLIEQETENSAVSYWRFNLPLMSDRDNVMRLQTLDLGDGGIFVWCSSCERKDTPLVPGVIRMFQEFYTFVRPSKEDPNITLYTEITYYDMKGSMPAFLLNMTMAEEAVKETRKMYDHMKLKYQS
mmetsp:Transcript_8411/g.14079  ORF Transcript_8411/g.14079 Transcript_8411/m.14079 type:complete len:182 (-) Transcript_8411:33-578(-)